MSSELWHLLSAWYQKLDCHLPYFLLLRCLFLLLHPPAFERSATDWFRSLPAPRLISCVSVRHSCSVSLIFFPPGMSATGCGAAVTPCSHPRVIIAPSWAPSIFAFHRLVKRPWPCFTHKLKTVLYDQYSDFLKKETTYISYTISSGDTVFQLKSLHRAHASLWAGANSILTLRHSHYCKAYG